MRSGYAILTWSVYFTSVILAGDVFFVIVSGVPMAVPDLNIESVFV
jgi:hypothetical protein